ncbi:hypothetical protein AAG570_004290 [Ranatra chinensis]|uniref:ubiquitinyl hydrolase 1 n=1 Tax=Ranatra chinensis TaxID=642074 RepID=A0ABD0Y0E7_9HEMI
MDDEERIRMAESGIDSDEYRRFMQQPSGNMDDSGYFSVQVISSALEVWGLELVPYNSTESLALEAQKRPETMAAYICHYRDHWFTIRKLGHQWFNLNSLLSGPELISDTYLAMFLAQLQQEGYSIFVVQGSIPACTADEILRMRPAVQPSKLAPPKQPVKPPENQDSELEKAIKLSLGQEIEVEEEEVDDDDELQAALRLSLQEDGPDPALEKALQLSLQVDHPIQPGMRKYDWNIITIDY